MASSTRRDTRAAASVAGRCALGIVLASAAVGAHSAPCKVEWERGVVTVNAVESRRDECLEAIAQRTGVTMSGTEFVTGTVTGRISALGVSAVLRQVAGDVSYTLVRNDVDLGDSSGNLSIQFLGKGSGDSARISRGPDIMRGQLAPAVRVENVETGRVEEQAPPRQTPRGPAPARPDTATPDVRVNLEN